MVFLFLVLVLAMVRYHEEQQIQNPVGLSLVDRTDLVGEETLKVNTAPLLNIKPKTQIKWKTKSKYSERINMSVPKPLMEMHLNLKMCVNLPWQFDWTLLALTSSMSLWFSPSMKLERLVMKHCTLSNTFSASALFEQTHTQSRNKELLENI